MELSNILIDKTVEYNNYFLKNEYVRIILLIISSVLVGYTLQPIPKWLNNLFDNSKIFNFFILFLAGTITVYPVNKNNLMCVTIGSILALILFQSARNLDKYLEQK